MVNALPNDTAMTASRPVFAASRLSAWCDRLIEMGWLAAVIVVPLFFNIYSSRVFEPDKLTTLRSIALVMALAWLVKWLEERGNPNRDTRVSWRTPLVIPTLLLVLVYMISTALSVAPRTSLLGSYQRLQGTYTTLSYIVVFFMVLQGLRTRQQLDRLLTVLVLNSFPIACYGLLQRLKLDPLPWGGDTFERVAGNMGNSIFVAAYLIMTFFVTLYKIIDAFFAIFTRERPAVADVVRAAAYIVILLMNAYVVLVLAGSRGPQLGWLAGLFFMGLLMVQTLRSHKLRLALTTGSIVIGLFGLGFLVWLNVDKTSPTAAALTARVPLFMRMSTVMQTSDGTNVVRALIWEGAAKLVAPHEPLVSPDGTPDRWNAIRPLIGYGPESMYVAYNRFYQPALANIEARNASPDRSHNETWDSLVITGVIGFAAYMLLFASVLYFGFSRIGLISTSFERILFVLLWIGGGAAVGGYFVASGRPNLFGVGVAAGICAGLALFLVISTLASALRSGRDVPAGTISRRDQMLIIAIIATVVAHFVEIHTGIAIASSRTHFWVLIAVLVVLGAGYMQSASDSDAGPAPDAPLEPLDIATPAATQSIAAGAGSTRRQRRAAQAQSGASAPRRTPVSRARAGGSLPGWFGTAAASGAVLGLMLGVLAFDFTNNIPRYTNAGLLFVRALVELPAQPGLREALTSSPGVLAMFLATLALGVVIFASELTLSGAFKGNNASVAPAAALIGAIAVFVWVAFGTFVAGRLVAFITSGQNSVDSILGIAEQLAAFPAYVYLLIIACMLGGAWVLRGEGPAPVKGLNGIGGLITGLIGIPVLALAVSYSNLQPIQADIIYKQASPWDQQGARLLGGPDLPIQGWDMAVEHHRRAIQLAPNEDFYYLWLGRALLEKARSIPNPKLVTNLISDSDTFNKVIDDGVSNWNRPYGRNALPSAGLGQSDLLQAARIILEEARVINPLNTDHSANLARMWLQTVDVVADPAEKEKRYANANREYGAATSLSPNNAQIYNEWANLLMRRGEYDGAQAKLDRSLAIDQKFDATRLLRASLFLTQAEQANGRKNQATQLIATLKPTDTVKLADAKTTLAASETQWKDLLRKAQPELDAALLLNPKGAQTLSQLTYVSQQLGDFRAAIGFAQKMVDINPKDWSAYRNLALLYNETKQKDKAIEAAKAAAAAAPQDQVAALQQLAAQLGAK